MTDMSIRSQEKKQKEFDETEQRKPAEELESSDQVKKKGNKIVKLAMAKELIKMGISRSSAHRILNISGHKGKDADINNEK